MSERTLQGPKFRYFMEEKILGYFFFHNADKYSDRICCIDGTIDSSQTYGDVKWKSIRAAMTMQDRGITSSSVVAFCSENSLDNIIPMLAAFYLGAKVANLDPTLSRGCIKYLLDLVAPKMIFVDEASVSLIEESLAASDFAKEIVVFGDSTKYLLYSDFIQIQAKEFKFKPTRVGQDEIAIIVFSSGTGGPPKIICHSHRSFMYLALRSYQIGERVSVLHIGTFFLLSAYVSMTCCFKAGTYRVFSSRHPSIESIFKMIEKYMINFIYAAPSLTYKLANFLNTSDYDTSSVRILLSTGTPLAPSQFKKMDNLFPNATTILVYEMAELGIATAFDIELDGDLPKTKLASCGKPAASVQLKVVPNSELLKITQLPKIVRVGTDEVLGPHQEGEVRLKSPSMMVGYYEGNSSFVFDEYGFFKTGDIGFYDEDQCVYVADKIEDMFRYQNSHIIPSVIEAVLLEHPAIKETVVFGMPCGGDGHVPAACVVLKENCDLTEEEIDFFLQERVADSERLRGGVTFLTNLPRTPTEKVLRQEIKNFIIQSKEG